jgi:putative oxidoreductase
MSVLAQPSSYARVSGLVTAATESLDRVPLSAPQLLARLALAGVFFRSGMTKIANWDLTVQLFQDEYRVPLLPPDLAALMASSLELTVPIFLTLGLLTRLACLPLLGMTAVIQIFVYPASWPDHLTWTALLILLLARGAGIISLDHLFFGARHNRG